jgi:hypothetical protein
VPLTNEPVTVIGLDVPLYERDIEGLEVIPRDVIVLPPSDTVKVIETCVLLTRVALLITGADGAVAGADTVAVLENASVDPTEFVARTRQRIGLKYPKVKKLEGGVYVDDVELPGAVTYVGESNDCHWYAYIPSESSGSHVPLLTTE